MSNLIYHPTKKCEIAVSKRRHLTLVDINIPYQNNYSFSLASFCAYLVGKYFIGIN